MDVYENTQHTQFALIRHSHLSIPLPPHPPPTATSCPIPSLPSTILSNLLAPTYPQPLKVFSHFLVLSPLSLSLSLLSPSLSLCLSLSLSIYLSLSLSSPSPLAIRD